MTTQTSFTFPGLSADALKRIESVRRIAVEVVGPAAPAVARDARDPAEAMSALKNEKLLSAHVPTERGGFGASVVELGLMCEALGQRCASPAPPAIETIRHPAWRATRATRIRPR